MFIMNNKYMSEELGFLFLFILIRSQKAKKMAKTSSVLLKDRSRKYIVRLILKAKIRYLSKVTGKKMLYNQKVINQIQFRRLSILYN